MTERTVFQSMANKHVVSVPPQASIREAAQVMTRAGCGSGGPESDTTSYAAVSTTARTLARSAVTATTVALRTRRATPA